MISFELDEDQQLFQETVRKFAADVLRPRAREHERSGFGAEVRRQAHELGLGALDLPEAAGGAGQSLVTACIVAEELAFGDPAAAVALSGGHWAAQAIVALGDEAQQQRLLAPLVAADGAAALGALAWCEPGKDGGDAFATRARPDGDGWILDGDKAWVVNAEAQTRVVFAGLDGAPAAFVLTGDQGVTVGERHQTLGLEAVRAHRLALRGVRAGRDQRLLGGADFLAATQRLLARIAIINAARQVGLARASYEFALAYTQERKAFGKTVAHFQAIAFTLADMHTDVEAARWSVWRAAWELEHGGHTTWAHQAAPLCNELAWRVADWGVQLLGGAGFIRDYPVEKWLRDTKTLALFGPPSEFHALRAASAELGHAVDLALPSASTQPFYL